MTTSADTRAIVAELKEISKILKAGLGVKPRPVIASPTSSPAPPSVPVQVDWIDGDPVPGLARFIVDRGLFRIEIDFTSEGTPKLLEVLDSLPVEALRVSAIEPGLIEC